MNCFSTNISRRTFLKTTAAGVATFAIGRSGFAANSKMQHACIGVGGMGWVDLNSLKDHPKLEIVALCDVDANNLAKAAELFPQARQYRDWRKLLMDEGKRIDSVNIAVPDHMHAPITMTALRMRKNIYCQKPLCHDVAECRAVTRAAKEAGVVTQLGTQYASSIAHRTAMTYLQQKAIGNVQRIIFTANRPGIDGIRIAGPRPAQGSPVPPELAWDLWLGTAPVRPYAPGIYHPGVWRSWQDFGTGWSADIGCHLFNAMWRGLKLKAPLSVVADVQESWKNSPARRADTWPQQQHITWIFPGNDMTGGKELKIEWFDGMLFPPEDIKKLEEENGYQGEAMMVIGTEGKLYLPMDGGPRLLPVEKFKEYPRPKLEPRNHYHSYVDACFGDRKTVMDFAVGGPMTEAILLGTVAVRNPGALLQWNPTLMRIPNAPQAERYLRRRYRKGWEVFGL
jgi:predicted dehydrogenase